MAGLSKDAIERIKAELQKAGVSQNDFASAVSELKVDTIRTTRRTGQYQQEQLEQAKRSEESAVSYMVNHPDHRQAMSPPPAQNKPGFLQHDVAALLTPRPKPFTPSADYTLAHQAVDQAHTTVENIQSQMTYGNKLRNHLVEMMKDFVKHGGKDQQTHGHDNHGEKVTKSLLQGFIQDASGADLAALMHSLPTKPSHGPRQR